MSHHEFYRLATMDIVTGPTFGYPIQPVLLAKARDALLAVRGMILEKDEKSTLQIPSRVDRLRLPKETPSSW